MCLPATCALVTLAGAKTHASWWHERPQLRAPAPAPAPGHLNADGGVVASAGEVGKGDKTRGVDIHSRSQPSKAVRSSPCPLPLLGACAASTAARRTCQIHRPAQRACPALANTALCLHCSLASALRFRLCRCLDGETAGYDVIGCAAQRQQQQQQQQQSCPTSGRRGRGAVVKWIVQGRAAGYREKVGEDGEHHKRTRTCIPLHHPPSAIPAASHKSTSANGGHVSRQPGAVGRSWASLRADSPSWAPSHANSSVLPAQLSSVQRSIHPRQTRAAAAAHRGYPLVGDMSGISTVRDAETDCPC